MNLLIVSHACATALNQQIYAEIQKQTGWKITLVIPRDWKDEFGNRCKARLFKGFDANLVDFPVWMNGKIITHIYRGSFRSLLRERDIDLVYINHEPYALATWQVAKACVKCRVPFGVYSCQNISKQYPPPFSWIERFVYRHAAFAFPITEAVGDVMKAKGYKGELSIVPLPLDPDLYRPNEVGEVPEALASVDPSFFIGYVGRMIEAKGLKTMANALVLIKDLDWKLCLIGKGEYLDSFLSILGKNGLGDRVLNIGYVPHSKTPRYLAAMDVLVLPSETQPNWKEQFGRVIPEAMACGTPVLGSDSGEIPNLIRMSGGGVVFPEKDAAALTATLRQFIEDEQLRDGLGKLGRNWVMQNLSIQQVATRMSKFLGRKCMINSHS